LKTDHESRHDHEVNRREFLGRSARQAASVAAGVLSLSPALGAAAESSADRIRVGIIGLRTRGKQLAGELIQRPDVEVAALCDVDGEVLHGAARQLATLALTGQPSLRLENDYRRLLEDRTLQGVVIATPDHWHASMACQAMDAGHDVYLESPATTSLVQGAELLTTMSRTGRIVQCGIQERSGTAYHEALRYLHTGRLGSVKLARAWVVHRRKPIPSKQDGVAPEQLDYRGWLGPAGERPYNLNRCHGNWRWFWDYGGGELAQWGSHLLDVARWGLQVQWPTRVTAVGGKYAFDDAAETPDTLLVQYDYGERAIHWEHRLWSSHAPEGRSSAVAFHGTRGVLVIDRGGWKVYDGEPAGGHGSSVDLDRRHLDDFLQAIRTRRTPSCDLPTGLVSAGLCHLGNIAYRVGREIRFDPRTGACAGDAIATALAGGP
jgi:predicted dehydrogenase